MSFSSLKTSKLLKRILEAKKCPKQDVVNEKHMQTLLHTSTAKEYEQYTDFSQFNHYKEIITLKNAAKNFHVENPFFKVHQGNCGAQSYISHENYINFSHYNYLGLSGHPQVNAAATNAIEKYGTSAGASRLVAGERPIHQELEQALAKIYNAEACAVFVSGHATNVTAIRTLFTPQDLIVHDNHCHNSIQEGIQLSGAARRSFPHNDLQALDTLLSEIRNKYQRVLIVAEGLYSMDGDILNLSKLITIKKRHGAFLMVDEAHALGVLGKRGYGIAEHCNVDPQDVDIWMGTLSKTLATCGGYIAGSQVLIDILKHYAPGFVYSVGISPPLAAASLAALHIMQAEPQRVRLLQENSTYFLKLAQEYGFDTGLSQGFAITVLICGSSRKTVNISNALFKQNINVQPIIYPAVEEKASRLRFFISALTTQEDMEITLKTLHNIAVALT